MPVPRRGPRADARGHRTSRRTRDDLGTPLPAILGARDKREVPVPGTDSPWAAGPAAARRPLNAVPRPQAPRGVRVPRLSSPSRHPHLSRGWSRGRPIRRPEPVRGGRCPARPSVRRCSTAPEIGAGPDRAGRGRGCRGARREAHRQPAHDDDEHGERRQEDPRTAAGRASPDPSVGDVPSRVVQARRAPAGSTITTVTLSIPPAAFARRTSSSAASPGSPLATSTVRISSSPTWPLSPSEQRRKRSPCWTSSVRVATWTWSTAPRACVST